MNEKGKKVLKRYPWWKVWWAMVKLWWRLLWRPYRGEKKVNSSRADNSVTDQEKRMLQNWLPYWLNLLILNRSEEIIKGIPNQSAFEQNSSPKGSISASEGSDHPGSDCFAPTSNHSPFDSPSDCGGCGGCGA